MGVLGQNFQELGAGRLQACEPRVGRLKKLNLTQDSEFDNLFSLIHYFIVELSYELSYKSILLVFNDIYEINARIKKDLIYIDWLVGCGGRLGHFGQSGWWVLTQVWALP